MLNPFNRTFSIEELNTAGIKDEKLILSLAKEIMFEYPGIEFKELLGRMIYRLVTLIFKEKKQDKTNQSLPAIFNNITDGKSLKFTTANHPKLIEAYHSALPQLSDLTTSHLDKSVLRQNRASEVDQYFYTNSPLDSQQLALIVMRQLMQPRLYKLPSFDRWRSQIEAVSLSVAS